MSTRVVQRITLVVDTWWGDAIGEFTQYVENGEVCEWESTSAPFMYEVDDDDEEVSA